MKLTFLFLSQLPNNQNPIPVKMKIEKMMNLSWKIMFFRDRVLRTDPSNYRNCSFMGFELELQILVALHKLTNEDWVID